MVAPNLAVKAVKAVVAAEVGHREEHQAALLHRLGPRRPRSRHLDSHRLVDPTRLAAHYKDNLLPSRPTLLRARRCQLLQRRLVGSPIVKGNAPRNLAPSTHHPATLAMETSHHQPHQ